MRKLKTRLRFGSLLDYQQTFRLTARGDPYPILKSGHGNSGHGTVPHPYPFCHREERSDVAISFPQQRSLPQRDCRASLAMTVQAKWVRVRVLLILTTPWPKLQSPGGP